MKKYPKDASLYLLKAILEVKNLKLPEFPEVSHPDYYFYTTAPHEEDFFFGIKNVSGDKFESLTYLVDRRPTNRAKSGITTDTYNKSDMLTSFQNWQDLISEHEDVVRELEAKYDDDSILEQYEEEEYLNFEELTEEDNTKSFSLPAQLFIDGYLGLVVKRLNHYKDEIELEPQQKEDVEQIVNDAIHLKSIQTKLTREQVAKSLAKLWAKARKAGLETFTEVRKEIFKEGIKKAAKYVIDSSWELGETINGLLGGG